MKLKISNLSVFFLILTVNYCLFLVHQGSVIMFNDASREFYIPYAMNSGAVLYKDIFNVYPPLGYQINAFLTSIFPSVKTLYFMGFLNSTFILFGLYLILRFFIKKNFILNILIVFFIMSCCVYSVSATNYTVPYSYSLVYALNAFIWSITALLYYLKKQKTVYLYSCFFLAGFCFCSRFEFIPYILILFVILFRENCKAKILSLFFLLITPILSLSVLFIQGLSVEDIKNAVNYTFLLSKSESVKHLYTYLGFIPSWSSLKVLVYWFFQTLGLICIFPVIPFSVNSFIETNAFYFNWIGILALALLLIFYKKIYQDKPFFTLYVSTILISLKCIFNISFNSYGTYYFPLLFICVMILICRIEKLQKILIIILACFTFTYTVSNIQRNVLTFEYDTYSKIGVKLERGTQEAVFKTLDYIKSNTTNADTIIVIPEGALINYLTDRKSHNKYYYLIPANVEIFGINNIAEDLKNNPPDYIILNGLSYNNFGESSFCNSFGEKVCTLFNEYYNYPIIFGTDFQLAIFKKRKINENK